MTKEERIRALITNLRQFEPLKDAQFKLELEDVPIVLEALEKQEINSFYAKYSGENKTEA